jgi:lipoyl(octanoyl) transferase
MVEWITSTGLTDFREAEAWMEARVADIHKGVADECILHRWHLRQVP